MRSEGVLADAVGAVMSVEPGQKPLMEVILRPYHRDRSLEQNDRLWALHGAAADYVGEEHGAQAMHEACCRRFLGKRTVVDPISHAHYEITNTTTQYRDPDTGKVRKLTVAEMTKFMNQVEQLYISLGIPTAQEPVYGQEKEKTKDSTGDER